MVLQQKTEREKNDTNWAPSPEYGGRIFPSGDPSSTPHTTESCTVTVFMNYSRRDRKGKGTMEFTVFKFGFCFVFLLREKRRGKVEQLCPYSIRQHIYGKESKC